MTSVQKLSRIVLICRQAERLAEFYIRAFRFACIEDSPKIDPGFAELIGLAKGQVRITSLRLGNQEIALAETQPPRMRLSGRCSWMGSAVSAFRDCSGASVAAPQPPSGEHWLHEIKHHGFQDSPAQR